MNSRESNKAIRLIFILFFMLMFNLACSISVNPATSTAPFESETEPPQEVEEPIGDGENVVEIWAENTEIAPGDCTMLGWFSTGGKVNINGFEVAPSGEYEVCPEETETYTLEVEDGDNFIGSNSVTVTLLAKEPSPSSSGNPTPTVKAKQEQSPFTFSFSPKQGPAGTEVTLTLSQEADIIVNYDGKPLPKKVLMGGKAIVVSIPGGAKDAYFRLTGNGLDIRSNEKFKVTVKMSTGSLLKFDLAITDLFPDSLPKGKIISRVTFNGPAKSIDTTVDMNCTALIKPLPGIFAPSNPIRTFLQIIVSQLAGETKTYPIGIDVDADIFTYDITCEIIPKDFFDENSSNNTYQENIP